MSDTNNKLLILTGPTASGKTDYAIQMAQQMNGEIVSADSMQIYKYMDIGTAKPTLEERCGIPHHLMGILNPDQQFSVAQYKQMAEQCINEILHRGNQPILVGGTGLYIKSIIDNIIFPEIESDENYRHDMIELSNQKGREYIHNMLMEIDPVTAQRLHPNDLKRVIRALEVYKCTKRVMSEHIEQSKRNPTPYDIKILTIDINREMLYDRINKRVDRMMSEGLLNEVLNLKSKGFGTSHHSMQGLGYKQILEHLEGTLTLDQAVELIKRDTRRYAKRQLTWIRNSYKDMNWTRIALTKSISE